MTESFELGEKCGRFNEFGTGSMHLGLRFNFNEGVQFTCTLFSKSMVLRVSMNLKRCETVKAYLPVEESVVKICISST